MQALGALLPMPLILSCGAMTRAQSLSLIHICVEEQCALEMVAVKRSVEHAAAYYVTEYKRIVGGVGCSIHITAQGQRKFSIFSLSDTGNEYRAYAKVGKVKHAK